MGISKVEINNSDGTKNVLVDLTGDTVTADKMLENETAHGADGEPITGTIVKRTQILSVNHVNDKGVIVGNNIGSGGVERLGLAYYTKNDSYFGTGTYICTVADYDNFGDATAEDVVKGKTFTSVAGFKVTGTHECSSGGDSTLNCEMQTISNVTSPKVTFNGTGGTYKVYGYGKGTSSGYMTPKYAFAGNKYYTISSWGNDTTNTLNITVDSSGNISGLPSLTSGELVIVRVPS